MTCFLRKTNGALCDNFVFILSLDSTSLINAKKVNLARYSDYTKKTEKNECEKTMFVQGVLDCTFEMVSHSFRSICSEQ